MSKCPKCRENSYKFNEKLSDKTKIIWTCFSCGYTNDPSKYDDDDDDDFDDR